MICQCFKGSINSLFFKIRNVVPKWFTKFFPWHYMFWFISLFILPWPMKSLGEGSGTPLQYCCTVARKIPWMEEPGGLQSMGSLRVRHDWVTWLSLSTFMHWRRKWQPTPVFLPGESHGQRSLVGCSPWGRTESDTTEVTWQAAWNPCRSLFWGVFLCIVNNGNHSKGTMTVCLWRNFTSCLSRWQKGGKPGLLIRFLK